jgi:hypothetical protein
MQPTLTARMRRWPAIAGAAFALALCGALAPDADALVIDGPAFDTGLYLPADPGTGYDGGPSYEPGADGADSDHDGGTIATGGHDHAGPRVGSEGGGAISLDPASADDGGADVPVEAPPGAEGNQWARGETERALRLADEWLRKAGCDAFISGSASRSAFERLHELMTRQGAPAGIEERPNEVKRDDDGVELESVAVQGPLRSPTIILYSKFFRAHPDDIRSYSTTLPPGASAPGEDQIRAMLILHELAHITGALPTEHLPDDPDGLRFDRRILDRCLHNTETARPHPPVPMPGPAPVHRPSDDDIAAGGGSADPGAGYGQAPPPLPDSNAPVLRDCCAEVPGGAAAGSGGGRPYDPDANYDDPFDPAYDDNPGAPGDDDPGYFAPDQQPSDPGYGGGGGGGSAGCGRGDIDSAFDYVDEIDVFCTA